MFDANKPGRYFKELKIKLTKRLFNVHFDDYEFFRSEFIMEYNFLDPVSIEKRFIFLFSHKRVV